MGHDGRPGITGHRLISTGAKVLLLYRLKDRYAVWGGPDHWQQGSRLEVHSHLLTSFAALAQAREEREGESLQTGTPQSCEKKKKTEMRVEKQTWERSPPLLQLRSR